MEVGLYHPRSLRGSTYSLWGFSSITPEPFLLIVPTNRLSPYGTVGYWDVPAFGQLLPRHRRGWDFHPRNYNCTLSGFIVTAAVHSSFISRLIRIAAGSPFHLTYEHWAGLSPYTLDFSFAGTCVLDKQSQNTLLLSPPKPCGNGGKTSCKLTSSFFAEFLKHGSPDRLSLLDQSTCVGLRYGRK